MTDKYNSLNDFEQQVIINKGTERPFTGEYTEQVAAGMYLCRQCDSPLYTSAHKFQSSCGWPSFDDEIPDAISRVLDSDGRRTEIVCANCQGHLGHVFEGERLTESNIRHCVNSISMKFVSADEIKQQNQAIKTAYFAGGCFWGIEHLMQQQLGVINAESGYMGGELENPDYYSVCHQNTGHIEVVEVSYDPQQVSYETLTKLFFEIHDPTQLDKQGPDVGPEYASAIFYQDENEKHIAESLIGILKDDGLQVVTQLRPVCRFWKADERHQDFYQKNGYQPYCHTRTKRF